MRSRIFNLDWERFDHKDAEQRKQLSGALQYFLALPDRYIPPSLAKIQAFADAKKEIRELQVKLQEFTTTGDFPASILPLIEKFHIIPQYDNGYEQIFDIRDFSGSKRNGFTVSIVQSGLSFRRVIVGEKLKVYQMSGEKEECYFDFYGGALGWHRMLFDDGDWWTIEDNAIEFRNKAYFERASIYYALVEAVASVKSACIPLTDVDCDDCDAIALIDGNALNLAAQTILVNNANKGYGISPQNVSFIVLSSVQMRGRVRRALGYNYQKYPGTEKNIDYNFTQLTTMMLQNTNQIFVILPKITLKGGYRMDLTLFSDFDILSYTDTQAGWMRYGGCIGDIDQIECIDMTLPSGRSQ